MKKYIANAVDNIRYWFSNTVRTFGLYGTMIRIACALVLYSILLVIALAIFICVSLPLWVLKVTVSKITGDPEWSITLASWISKPVGEAARVSLQRNRDRVDTTKTSIVRFFTVNNRAEAAKDELGKIIEKYLAEKKYSVVKIS